MKFVITNMILVACMHIQTQLHNAHNFVAAIQKDTSTSNVIFFDDFNDNKNNWTVESNKNVKASIDNGIYHLTAVGHAYGEAQELKINTRKDFEIETRIKIVSGDADHKSYFSVLFWGREAMNSYYFTFAGDGFTSVKLCDGKKATDCETMKESLQKTLSKPNDFNIYTVRKTGRNYSFLINGTKVYEMPFAPFFGNMIGFGAGRKVTLAVDYLKVSYLEK